MSYDKEEQERRIRQASKHAIALALEGRWSEAVDSNKVILESFPDDIDTLNRMGRALLELGEYAEAGKAYARAKELDPYNSIAEKNLRRLEYLENSREAVKTESNSKLDPNRFIKEMGKAGVLRLQKLGSKEALARMVSGDRVVLDVVDGDLQVRSDGGEYLGEVEARYGQRLARLMAGGNKYEASVTSSPGDALVIIIREVYQHPSQMGVLSFPLKDSGGTKHSYSDKSTYRYSEFEDGLLDDAGESFLGEEEDVDILEESEEE